MSSLLLWIVVVGLFLRGRRGKGSAGADLSAVLGGAEAAGIINAEQRERILAHAAEHGAGAARGAGVAWLAIFAGLFVVAGVALLIARNWEDIGPLVRVGAFLVVLVAVGEATIRTRERGAAVNLPLELLWFFLPLLGIGLYGQTFQLSGEPLRPFLAWLALTAPLAWLSPRPVVATIHAGTMAIVLFTGNFVLEPLGALFWNPGAIRQHGMLALTGGISTPLAWTLSLGMLAAIALESTRRLPRAHRHHFVGVWVSWVWALLVAPTPLRLQHEGWLIVATVALATVWIVALTAMETSLEERATSVGVWLASLYALTFTWHMTRVAEGTTTTSGLVVTALAVVVAIGATLAVPAAKLSPLPAWATAAKTALLVPLLTTLLYLGSDVSLVWLAGALMNVILVGIAVGLMWHGSLAREPLQVNVGVLVLVGMLITRFLDVFGNMLRSGIGFIVAGVLLATLSWALDRTRRRLIGMPREAGR